MLAGLRVLWLLSIAAFGAVIALVYASSTVRFESEADAYASRLRSATELDARLDRDVLRTRAGIVPSYDVIVSDVQSLQSLRARLLAAPTFLPGAARRELEQSARGWSLALEEKVDLVDEFKKHDAVLKNSIRFLPEGCSELGKRLRSEPTGDALAAVFDELARRVLRFYAVPERDDEERVEETLQLLATFGGPDADILARHARVILHTKRRVDATIDAMTKLPMSDSSDAMDDAYARHHQAIRAKAMEHKLALVLVAIAVVALGAADGLLRMRRTAADQRKLAERLEQANVALRREQEREKELSDLKTSFVSMASHEFRTPLSVILSSTELLEVYWERWSAGKKREHFTRIQEAMKTMTLLLDQILVIGRADANRLELDPQPMDVAAFCEEITAAMRQTTRGERVIDLQVPDGIGSLELDEKLLRHILTNLLSNAVKYSGPDTKVTLAVAVTGRVVTFTVRDRGIGIPEEDLAHLFESFHRCKNVGDVKGTGLGLAVVKRAVERHGGTIDVSSEVGAGTELVVRLPVGRSEA